MALTAVTWELGEAGSGLVVGRHRPRYWLGLAVAGLFAWFVLAHRAVIGSGLVGLAGAKPAWLVLAAVAGAGLTLAAAVAQVGTLAVRVPFGTMCAAQLAASFAGQLTPVGTGAFAVMMRFLRRQGLSGGTSAAALGLSQFAGIVTRLLLLVLAIGTERGSMIPRLPAADPAVIGVVIGALPLVVVATRLWVRRLARRLVAWVRAERVRLAAVMRSPSRAAALWCGSLATPLLQAFVLYAVGRSLGVHLGLWHVLALYLAASTIAAVVPTPGGLGAIDLTVAAGLIGAGVPAAAAAGTTVVFRLITAWLPLLPAGLALVVLHRRRLI